MSNNAPSSETQHTRARSSESHARVAGSYVVIDLGKRRGSEIRNLRNGEGRLFAAVEHILDQLKADGVSGQPIFVVEESRDALLF
jgi:hypothetical protein